jgi:hypothetical protein
MEGKGSVFETLIESAEEFGKTSFELLKYKALDKATFAVSTVVLNLTVVFFGVLFIIMLSTGVSIWIGYALDKIYLGFLIVAAFYAILAMMIYFMFGASIKKLVTGFILKQIFK